MFASISPQAAQKLNRLVSITVTEIRRQMRDFDHRDINPTWYLLRTTDGFSWHEESRLLNCKMEEGNGQLAAISIYLPEHESAQGLLVRCSCRECKATGRCRHTYAAMSRLVERLSQSDRALAKKIFAPQIRVGWDEVLADLDRFLSGYEESKDEPEQKTRLTWRIDYIESPQGAPRFTIDPFEQKLTKNGKRWTRGRKLSLESLLSSPEKCETLADKLILGCVQKVFGRGAYFNPYSDVNHFDMLRHLIGHPMVYWHKGNDAVDVRQGQPGLAIENQKDGSLRLVPAVDGQPYCEEMNWIVFEDQGVIIVDRPGNAITVAATKDPRVFTMLGNIATNMPAIPAIHQDELVSRIPALERVLPVSLPDRLISGTTDAPATIFLQLTPTEPQGLTVQLRVRPIPDGDFYLPGQGPPQLTLLEDDRRIQVQRNQDAESLLARRVIDELQLNLHFQPHPWQWHLPTDDEALDLITTVQDREADDIELQWPQGVTMKISREITPSSLRVQIDDRQDWFGLKGTVEIDGEQISLSELLTALRRGRRFVSLGKGKWARISEVFRRRLEALNDVVHPDRSGKLELDLSAAPVLDDLLDDEVAVRACQSWRDLTTRLDEISQHTPEAPRTLAAELRDYQVDGYRWLSRLAAWGVGGCLADDMGLGKTIQALAMLLERAEAGPALVVAPTSVGYNWVRETTRFAPTMSAHLYRESNRDQLIAAAGPGDIVIVSYQLLRRDSDRFTAKDWNTLVLDEAQFVKNAQTKTARAVRDLKADWRIALTGTPVENHLGELWSLFRAVSPGLFGSWERFRKRFAEPIERQKDYAARQALAHVVRPFILRRTKAEVLDELPPRTDVRLEAELSDAERKLYEDARMHVVSQLAADGQSDGQDQRFQVLAALTRLRQLACHPALEDSSWKKPSAKLALLMETVHELRQGNHRALVFSQFTRHLALIRAELEREQIPYQYLDGQTTPRQREERIDAFQRGQGDLFLISLKAGGTGLNLTAADYVIHMDPWWNPAVEDQAADRAHRIGQTRPVTVYRLVAKDTIEEKILALHAEKRDLVSGVLEGTDQAGKLSTSELVALIRSG